MAGTIGLRTEPAASPTGFPFKVIQLGGTLSDPTIYPQRVRKCDAGYLRAAYCRPDGSVGHRCPAEPVEQYVLKGGDPADTPGRKCLCNGLVATIGLGQVLGDGSIERPILTAGEDVAHIGRFLKSPNRSYSAADVIQYVLGNARASDAAGASKSSPVSLSRGT